MSVLLDKLVMMLMIWSGVDSALNAKSRCLMWGDMISSGVSNCGIRGGGIWGFMKKELCRISKILRTMHDE